MHRCMILLAVSGILVGHLSAADDPFDFSSPLQSRTTRTAQYFARTTAADAAASAEPAGKTASAPSGTAARLLEGSTGSPAAAQQPAVRFGQRSTLTTGTKPVATSPTPAPRDPRETLQRFDEFLKTRDVVSAEYTEAADQPASQIRQIQATEDLPAFGDLDGNPFAAQPAAQPATDRADAVHGLLLGDPRNAAGGRLTDPIPTTPGIDVAAPAQEFPTAEPALSDFEASTIVEPGLSIDRTTTATVPAATTMSVRRAQTADDTQAAPAAIRTNWTLLDPLNVGQQCRAELVVTNAGAIPAERVSLEVRVPESIQVLQASPEPVEQVAFLGWKIPALAAGESMTIQLVLQTTQAGPLDLATYVRHTTAQVNSYTVTEPQLELAVSGPESVHVGEPASQTLVIKNPGSGTATNVTIDALIPAGLEHATGEHLQMDIGSLNPGEVRSVRLVMAAVAGGNHIVQVEAKADSGLVRTAAAEVSVIAPSLQAGISGPSLRYLGREAEYTLRVHNDGSAATDFVQVNHRIPEGFEFVRANRGATFDANTRVLNWYVGRLESGESLDLSLALLPTAAGEFIHLVRATSEMGAHSDAQLTTRVQGAASLVVKVADLDDPVEVETETAYEITVTNEGTAAAQDVGLTCELPQGLAFLKAEGPADHKLQNEFIGFRPVTELAPGKSLNYRVFVKGAVAGDQRFRCRLTSESLKQPLFTEELTKFYAE
jgi:uncharacterized repeat protein (TIGR01451 family)